MTGAWWTSLAGPSKVRWAALLLCLVATRVLTRVDGAIIAQVLYHVLTTRHCTKLFSP